MPVDSHRHDMASQNTYVAAGLSQSSHAYRNRTCFHVHIGVHTFHNIMIEIHGLSQPLSWGKHQANQTVANSLRGSQVSWPNSILTRHMDLAPAWTMAEIAESCGHDYTVKLTKACRQSPRLAGTAGLSSGFAAKVALKASSRNPLGICPGAA